MYIHTWSYGPTGPQLTVDFQQTDTYRYLPSNINGSQYVIPLGQWVHFRWQVKVSTEQNGNPRTGHLYGWINGVKRWEYNNINTINSGRYTELNLNSTFNNPFLEGPNQKRYWDLFSVDVTRAGQGAATASSLPSSGPRGMGGEATSLLMSSKRPGTSDLQSDNLLLSVSRQDDAFDSPNVGDPLLDDDMEFVDELSEQPSSIADSVWEDTNLGRPAWRPLTKSTR
jgi:hypothetical protein